MVFKATTVAAPAPPQGKDAAVDGAANGGGQLTALTLQQQIDDGTAEVSDFFVSVSFFSFCEMQFQKCLSLFFPFLLFSRLSFPF